MRALIRKSEIRGEARAPSSKSYTIRALMCAALASGESEIISPLDSDDTLACAGVLGQIGSAINQQGNSWQIGGGELHQIAKPRV